MPPAPPHFPTEPNVSSAKLLHDFNIVSPGPNYLHAQLPAHSHLDISGWEHYSAIVEKMDATLIPQLKYGFTMGINRQSFISIPFTNHKSARVHYQTVDDFIIKHYATGAIVGPYTHNPLSADVHPSPLQVAVSSSGKKRCVIDMSYPHGSSINSAIPSDWCLVPGFQGSFKLPTHDRICSLILQTEDPMMYVTDLAAFYMQIPSDLADAPYLAFTWRGNLYFHRRLPFGCRTACLHAQRVSDAVAAIHRGTAPGFIEPYVDDFDGIVTARLAARAHAAFHVLLARLGLGTTPDKCISPTYEAIFLGLLYNLLELTLTLPQEKVIRVLDIIDQWLHKDTCNKQELQSLLGLLNHLTTVVHAGRPFTASLLDVLRSDSFPHPVTAELHKDLQTWKEFLHSKLAVKSIMKCVDSEVPDAVVSVAVKDRLCAVSVCDVVSGCSIQCDEHIPPHAMYAIAIWFVSSRHIEHIHGRLVIVLVPTKAAALVINRANTTCSVIRPLLREMWLTQANADCVIKAVWDKHVNNQYLFREFIDFENVTL